MLTLVCIYEIFHLKNLRLPGNAGSYTFLWVVKGGRLNQRNTSIEVSCAAKAKGIRAYNYMVDQLNSEYFTGFCKSLSDCDVG